MFEKFGYPEFAKNGESVLVTRDGIYRDMLMDIRVYRLERESETTFFSLDDEQIVLLLTGEADYAWKGTIEAARRDSLFEEGPYLLHVPKGVAVTVFAHENAEVLVQKTENEGDFDPVFFKPADVRSSISGKGLFEDRATRIVRTAVDYENAPYSKLVIGEIITESGGWSSFIPHDHPQPEVYYYRYERPEAFGAQFIGDEVFKIENHSFSALPGGKTHPCVTAPGYRLWTCWMIRHFDDAPWTERVDDPRYLWQTEC
ncbi:MAG: 5-deoxy-glucuronate isomerase [Clostridiales Family XIII bacterium]|jgi:5-deoxy-glucuronate isomerase|nr:5-deoxy-glucuronate isomerase [Clostridiales Family XIII bacterium]